MCLITFRYDQDSEYPFVLIANRDESYQRESLAIHRWEDKPTIIGGRDLKAGGTWLAMNDEGKFAAITNQPFTQHEPVELTSRGILITDYLSSDLTPVAYAEHLRKQRFHYEGYQLLFGTVDNLYVYNNVSDSFIDLDQQLYSISNTQDDLSSYRQEKSERQLMELLTQTNVLNIDVLIHLFQDQEVNPNFKNYPRQLNKEYARAASSIFIQRDDVFGTVSTTAILINRQGEVKMKEVKYDPKKLIQETVLDFKLSL
ncbi:NRDE family protein [Aerococcaceae bacterium WGS1372]